MSRIYEALQKAESERKLERHGEPRTPVNEVDQMPSTAAVADYEAPVTFEDQRMVERIDEMPAPLSMGGGLNLSAVPRLHWNLSASRLPSLLERGPAIE